MTLILFPAPLSFHYRALETGFKTTAKKKKKKNYYFFTLNQQIFLIIKRTRNSSKFLANNDTK